MNEDRKLQALVQFVREDERRTDDLEARALAGTLGTDDEEEAFLRSALGAADDDALASAALRASGSRVIEGEHERAARPKTLARSAPSPRPHALRWAFAAAAVAALAAVLMLVVVAPRGGDALPAYTALIEGTDTPDRATPSGGNVVTHGAALVLVAQPRERVAGTVEARAFAGCGGTLTKLAIPVTVASSGAVRITGSPALFFGAEAEGPCAIAIAIGRPGSLPERFADVSHSAVRVDLVVRRK